MTLANPLTPIRLDNLKRRLLVAFEFAPPDEQTLAEIIYQHRARVYQLAMTEQARASGSRKRGLLPRGADAQYLRDVSLDDARSIRNTFNRDLERQIEKLYAANPAGGRDYYVSNLTQWADDRAAWKDRQIALMNEKTARFYAQQRFKDMNRIAGEYLFDGPPPVCDDCVDKFALGRVGQREVDVNPTPLHQNCPHEWKLINARLGVSASELWTGA